MDTFRERLRNAAIAAAEANGLRIPPAPPPPVAPTKPATKSQQVRIAPRALKAATAPTPTKRPSTRDVDRVVFVGSAGVLVRAKDGRLPRDGEVEPDGACVRLACRGGFALVVGALRTRPRDGSVKWITPAEMHANDRELVRQVAPQQLADFDARRRVIDLAVAIATTVGCAPTGDPESDLETALAMLRERALDATPDVG